MGSIVPVKKAIVLLNLGGPSSFEEIRPFLFNLFYDPAMVTLPGPLRYLLAQVISRGRLKKARIIYGHLGGGSPILKNTKAQAAALEEELGDSSRVFIAMRYSSPMIQETVEEVKAYNPDEILLLPLYPQYSTTTTQSSFKEWKKASQNLTIPTRYIWSYPTEDGFLEAIKELTLTKYREAKIVGNPRVLLTAHGLPEKIVKKGDPYQHHVEQTAKKLIEKLGVNSLDSVLCYQSRVGPLKWITPLIEDEIKKAAQEKRPLVVVPISFVSEHSETLVELDIIYRKLALQEGCPSYHRVETVQTHPSFIKGLAHLVKGETRCFLSII